MTMDEPIVRAVVVGYAVLLTLSAVSLLKGWRKVGVFGVVAGILPLIGAAVILGADQLIDFDDAEEEGWVLGLFVVLPVFFLVGGALLIALGAAGWHSIKRAQPGSWWETTLPVFRFLIVLPGLVVVLALPTELLGLARVTASVLVNTGIVAAGLIIGALVVVYRLVTQGRGRRPPRQLVADAHRTGSSPTTTLGTEPRHDFDHPTGSIKLNTSFNRSMLFLSFVNPRLEVNDEPIALHGWGDSDSTVDAGPVKVAVYFPYLMLRRAATATLIVDVPEQGEVSLRYRAPLLVFLKGHLEVVQ